MGYKTEVYILQAMFSRPGYKWLAIKTWIIVLAVFLWLPRINLLSFVLTQAPLSFIGKLSFIWHDFTKLVASIKNPVIFSTIVFSIMTAVSICLLIFMIRTSKLMNKAYQSNKKSQFGVATAVFGSHILSCGGTLLLAPVLPFLSGGSSVVSGTGATINLWLGTGANIVGILLVLIAVRRTSKDMVKMLLNN